MSRCPPFQTRPLAAADTAAAVALARAAGPQGVYLANALVNEEGEAFGCHGAEELLGCLWFGPRGNLVVIERAPLDPERLADDVQRWRWPWRIALGPAPILAALARRLSGAPLVHREQVYYACSPAAAAAAAPPLAAGLVRPAQRADRDRLMQATLELNRTDLNVDPRRVDRRWLRDLVDSRIGDGSTLVLGPPGAFACKLDLGSSGAAGLVIEGVFTFPESRGRGHARTLVATAAAGASADVVCLHVAADNAAARRAYEQAGMRAVSSCSLLLSG